jgi:hypothetical protein
VNKQVQDILVLFHHTPALDSGVFAWSRYFASVPGPAAIEDEEEPPYPTVLEAMRDEWVVLQMAQLKDRPPGAEYDVGYFEYQTVLHKMVSVDEETAR